MGAGMIFTTVPRRQVDFSRVETMVKFHFTHSETTRKTFFYCELTAQCQISKSRGSLAPPFLPTLPTPVLVNQQSLHDPYLAKLMFSKPFRSKLLHINRAYLDLAHKTTWRNNRYVTSFRAFPERGWSGEFGGDWASDLSEGNCNKRRRSVASSGSTGRCPFRQMNPNVLKGHLGEKCSWKL